MSGKGFDLKISPVAPEFDGGTGQRWYAAVEIDGHVDYDGGGATIEEAMAALILQMAEALAE